MEIVLATSPMQIEFARGLFLEYEREINVDLCFQGFAEELESLPGKYAPPDGCLLLAMVEQRAVGCVALRRFDQQDCEMKRLYVQPNFRGRGISRELADRIITHGRELGFRRMLLDTLDTMLPAQGLYRSLGFESIAAYYDNPLPGVRYYAKNLVAA